LTGAVALAQVGKLDMIVAKMRAIKKIIKDGIRRIDREYGAIEFREILDEDGDIGHSLFMFFKTPAIANRFIRAMQAENVGHAGHARSSAHLQWPWLGQKKTATPEGCPFTCPHYRSKVAYPANLCPRTEDLTGRGASLYISPIFTKEYARDVVRGVGKVLPYALTGKED
jgi:8-amino-3,8-dideoxy-alpha-D-manno-octulosonate transaminase